MSAADLALAAVLVGAVLAAVPVGVGVAIALALVRRVLWFARRRLPLPPRRASLVGSLAREIVAQLRIIGWTLARRGRAVAAGGGRPVVLVHGLLADGSCMWALRRALIARGRATDAPSLGPVLRPISAYAERLAAALARHEGPIDVVCHSLGGIVLRACLERHQELRARIGRVVTIASPHDGSGAARWLPLPEARALVPGGAFITALPSLRALLPAAAITTIASRHDNVVYPHATSRVDGAVVHELDDIGHAELLVHARVSGLVVDALDAKAP